MDKSVMYWSNKFRPLVDQEISKFVPNLPYPPNLYKPIWHALKSGGKRLRSTCAILTCKSFGGGIQKVIPFAAACELLHHGLLILDDIEDGDVYRREQPTIWFKYGINTSINVSFFLSQKIYEMILSLRGKNVNDKVVMDIYNLTVDTALKTGLGQTLDLHFKNFVPNEAQYMQMIKLKTGAYLVLPILGGAMITGANKKTIQLIKKYGDFIGPAYQIIDDILDYKQNSKSFGSDIKEGKRTLIIIHCLSKCSYYEKIKLIKILNKPREKTSSQDIEYAINLLRKYKSIDYSFNKAKFLVNKGKESISEIENNKAKYFLNKIADFIVTRNI